MYIYIYTEPAAPSSSPLKHPARPRARLRAAAAACLGALGARDAAAPVGAGALRAGALPAHEGNPLPPKGPFVEGPQLGRAAAKPQVEPGLTRVARKIPFGLQGLDAWLWDARGVGGGGADSQLPSDFFIARGGGAQARMRTH